MFGKLLFLVLAAGLTAAGLLVLRHQRIEATHEMSAVHRQMLRNERALWSLRCTIARQCRPEEVRDLMETRPGGWVMMPEPPAVTEADAPALSTARARAAEPFGG